MLDLMDLASRGFAKKRPTLATAEDGERQKYDEQLRWAAAAASAQLPLHGDHE
jgi:hypothetical protein